MCSRSAAGKKSNRRAIISPELGDQRELHLLRNPFTALASPSMRFPITRAAYCAYVWHVLCSSTALPATLTAASAVVASSLGPAQPSSQQSTQTPVLVLLERRRGPPGTHALPSPDLPRFRHGKTCALQYVYHGVFCDNNNGRSPWYHLLCRPDPKEPDSYGRPIRRPHYRCPNDMLCYAYAADGLYRWKSNWYPGEGPAPGIICGSRNPGHRPRASKRLEEPDPDAGKDTTGRDWDFGFVTDSSRNPPASHRDDGTSSSAMPRTDSTLHSGANLRLAG